MAVPITLPCDLATCLQSSDVATWLVLFTTTLAILISSCFFNSSEQDEEHDSSDSDTTDVNRTPVASKRRLSNESVVAPMAPKAKKVCTRRDISPSPVARELFPNHTKSASSDSPPPAPRKSSKRPKRLTVQQTSSVRRSLDHEFANATSSVPLPPINDIRTIPSPRESISPRTQELLEFCPLGKTDSDTFMTYLNADADSLDYTNPNKRHFPLSSNGIWSYIVTMDRLYKRVRKLNEDGIALPHSGTGFHTSRFSSKYLLIDKLDNAVLNVERANHNLSVHLRDIYEKYKSSWQTVPQSFIHACQLCRDAHLLARKLSQEVSRNINLTPWSDW